MGTPGQGGLETEQQAGKRERVEMETETGKTP